MFDWTGLNELTPSRGKRLLLLVAGLIPVGLLIWYSLAYPPNMKALMIVSLLIPAFLLLGFILSKADELSLRGRVAWKYLTLLWAVWLMSSYFSPLREVISPRRMVVGPDGKLKIPQITLFYRPNEPEGKMQVVAADNSIVAELDWPTQNTFQEPKSMSLDNLQLRQLSPTGWVPRKCHKSGSDRLDVDGIQPFILYIDNRGGSAAQLRFGELEIQIGTNTFERKLVMPWDKRQRLAFLGEELSDVTDFLLIDLNMGHRYKLREVAYSQLGIQPVVPDSKTTLLNGKRIYPLKTDLEFFLRPATKEISKATSSMVVTLYELTDE